MQYKNSGVCTRCDSITDATIKNQCLVCNGGIFGYSMTGCLNCTSIPFGIGAAIGASIGSCICQTGYKWNYAKGECICDINTGYALTTPTTCVACSTLGSTTTINACSSCTKPYGFTGYVCVESSQITLYNPTTYSCPTGYALNTNFYTNETIKCSCSSAMSYYQSGVSCIACNATLPTGTTLAGCLSCSLT